MNHPSVLVIIPARGGSKGVPRKNLKPLLGRPLLAWTIDAAVKAETVDRVLVSTEDAEIAKVAKEWGAEVPFLRPAELAGDEAHSSLAIAHALQWLAEHENYRPDVVGMLLPTSPFRTERHINEALALFSERQAAAVIGVTRMSKHPAALRVLRDGALAPLLDTPILNVQRQEGEALYFVNGSLYLIRTELFEQQQTFHVAEAVPYPLSAFDSIDIDSQEDLQTAEILGKALFPKVQGMAINPTGG